MELVLFMTYGNGLSTWARAGILERELALYADHARAGLATTLVSYGGAEDRELAAGYPFLRVLCNARSLHPRLYAWAVPALHGARLRRVKVVKTNQLYGAHVAARVASLLGRPLVVRQGYGHYEHRSAESGEDSAAARTALRYEARYLRRADLAVFTSTALAGRARERHGIDPRRVQVIPNYVVDREWSPAYRVEQAPPDVHLLFFGRFTEQKNLQTLVQAMAGLPARLTLVGDGPQEASLRQAAARAGVRCEFPGRLPQAQVREQLRGASAFVLPSRYEGHPKSLLEAMCLGMPVIAADSPGIRELVRDGATAWTGAPTEEGLREALVCFLRSSPGERARRGQAAREAALATWSLAAVARRERDLYREAGWIGADA